MDDDETEYDVGEVEIDADTIEALMERAEALDEDWRIWGTLQTIIELLRTHAMESFGEQNFEGYSWSSGLLSDIKFVMLYMKKLSSEEEIEAQLKDFRELLGRVDKEEE